MVEMKYSIRNYTYIWSEIFAIAVWAKGLIDSEQKKNSARQHKFPIRIPIIRLAIKSFLFFFLISSVLFAVAHSKRNTYFIAPIEWNGQFLICKIKTNVNINNFKTKIIGIEPMTSK